MRTVARIRHADFPTVCQNAPRRERQSFYEENSTNALFPGKYACDSSAVLLLGATGTAGSRLIRASASARLENWVFPRATIRRGTVL